MTYQGLHFHKISRQWTKLLLSTRPRQCARSAEKARAFRPGFLTRTGTIRYQNIRIIPGLLFTAYPAQRNKTCVILLRSLGHVKSLGWLPSEPLRPPLTPALTGAASRRCSLSTKYRFCFVGLSDPETSFPDDAIPGYHRQPCMSTLFSARSASAAPILCG